MKKIIYALFLLVSVYSYAQELDEPLVVKLATESTLHPLYLLPIQKKTNNFQTSYLQSLEKVLAFDLNHNGSTRLANNNTEDDRLDLNDPRWKERPLFYVVQGQVHEGKITFQIVDIAKQKIKTSEAFALTGELNQDRRQIHRAADLIHKALFGTEGIANTRILYTLKSPTLNLENAISEVWEADYDGENARQLTHENTICVTPAYLPPKAGFTTGGYLYVSYILGQPKIFVGSLKEGKSSRLTYLRGNQFMPAISQQRDKIAFISDVTGNPDLFLQNFSPEKGAIGKPQQIFSARQATQGTPTFSPDGQRIAFVSNKDGSPKIYVIAIPAPGASLKDIKATLISKLNRENSAPSWSPDGTKLAYCARSGGDRQIWVYDFQTNQEKQITQGRWHKENPSWAPDSLHLVYNTSDPQKNDLFIINLNQPEAVQITSGRGEKHFPSWEPRLKA